MTALGTRTTKQCTGRGETRNNRPYSDRSGRPDSAGARCVGAVLMMLLPSAFGCGGSTSASTTAPASGRTSEIAWIHRTRCGNCHVRVETGTRTRAELEDAFTRHRKRVVMRPEQWTEMVDYLASGAPAR